MTDAARAEMSDRVDDPAWKRWAAQLSAVVAIEAIIAWLDADQPDPDQIVDHTGSFDDHSRITGVAFLASVSHGSFLAVKQGIQWLIADSAVELYQTRRRPRSGGADGVHGALVTWSRWASAPDA